MSEGISTAIKITDAFSPALKGLHSALTIVTGSLSNLQTQFNKPIDTSSINLAQKELAKVSSEFDRIANETAQAQVEQEKYNKSLSAGGGLAGKIAGAIAALATIEVGKQIIGAADNYANVVSRLKMMNDGLQTTAELEKMIRESADRTYSSFSTTADAVGKLGINAKNAFNNTQDVVNFVEQINKHLAIAGTTGAQAEGAWIQLTQAMANGVLRGDELQSVMDGMPTVVEAIKKEFGERGVKGSIKEIAEQGLITADIVKTALYKVADDTNKKFNDMTVTFSDLWTLFKNKADEALKPVYEKLNSISGSETARNIAIGLGVAVGYLGKGLNAVLTVASTLFNFIKNNLYWIQPLVLTVAAGFAIWGSALAFAKLQAGYFAVKTALIAAYQTVATIATMGFSGAISYLSAVMAVNPMTLWIIAGAALIGIFYAIVGAINHFTGASLSATGIIAGAVAYLGGAIANVLSFVWNVLMQTLDSILNPCITVAELVYNAFNNGFSGWIGGVKSALWTFVDWALSLIKPLIEVWDALKGTNYASTLQNAVSNKIAEGQTSSYKKFDRNMFSSNLSTGYTDPTALYKEYYEKGSNLGGTLSSYLKDAMTSDAGTGATMSAEQMLQNAKDSAKSAKDYGGTLDDIAKNTGQTAKNTQKDSKDYEEEMKIMRELGRREAVNKFTTANLKVMQNNSNNISSAVDADSIIERLTEGLREAVRVASER